MLVEDTHLYLVYFKRDRYHQLQEMIEWCHEYLGTGGYYWEANRSWKLDTTFGASRWSFKNPEHATMFALRWV